MRRGEERAEQFGLRVDIGWLRRAKVEDQHRRGKGEDAVAQRFDPADVAARIDVVMAPHGATIATAWARRQSCRGPPRSASSRAICARKSATPSPVRAEVKNVPGRRRMGAQRRSSVASMRAAGRPASPRRAWSARRRRRRRPRRARFIVSCRCLSGRAGRRRARRRASARRGRADSRARARPRRRPCLVDRRVAVAGHVDQPQPPAEIEEDQFLRAARRVRRARQTWRPVSALMSEDLPTFERPAKAISGAPIGGRPSARGGEEEVAGAGEQLAAGLDQRGASAAPVRRSVSSPGALGEHLGQIVPKLDLHAVLAHDEILLDHRAACCSRSSRSPGPTGTRRA